MTKIKIIKNVKKIKRGEKAGKTSFSKGQKLKKTHQEGLLSFLNRLPSNQGVGGSNPSGCALKYPRNYLKNHSKSLTGAMFGLLSFSSLTGRGKFKQVQNLLKLKLKAGKKRGFWGKLPVFLGLTVRILGRIFIFFWSLLIKIYFLRITDLYKLFYRDKSFYRNSDKEFQSKY